MSSTPTPADDNTGPDKGSERERLAKIIATTFGPLQRRIDPVLVVPAVSSMDYDQRVRLYSGGNGIELMIADRVGYTRIRLRAEPAATEPGAGR